MSVQSSINSYEVTYISISPNALPGFETDDFHEAALAWTQSCLYLYSLTAATAPLFPLGISLEKWQEVARQFLATPPSSFKDYLIENFDVFELKSSTGDASLFTGYFEPEIEGIFELNPEYPYPVHRKPTDLILIEDLGLFHTSLKGHRIAGYIQNDTLVPGPTRRQINEGIGVDKGLELCWVKDPIDLYFMHVQGCGTLVLPDGKRRQLCYDGTNGHAYRSLRQVMYDRGFLTSTSTYAEMKALLYEDIDRCLGLFDENNSYVFFKESIQGVGAYPVGRMGYILTPQRSLAVDTRFTPLGSPLWLETSKISGFMTAQDVGGAIKGVCRGDVFCGTGGAAGEKAGALNHLGRLFMLIPKQDKFT